MINPRNTFKGHRLIVGKNQEKVYRPDFAADNQLYREFGCNNEIDIMRNKPQYEGVVNSKLRQITDLSMDTQGISDEQLADGISVNSRSYDENEVAEYIVKEKDARLKELRDIKEKRQQKNN